MSAFHCNRATFDIIANACTALSPRPYSVNTWYGPEGLTWEAFKDRYPGVVSGDTAPACGVSNGRITIAPETHAGRLLVARMMSAENARSVVSRYPTMDQCEIDGMDEDGRHRVERVPEYLNIPVPLIAGALRCWDYQSCESDDHATSPAYWFLYHVQGLLVRHVAGDHYSVTDDDTRTLQRIAADPTRPGRGEVVSLFALAGGRR